MTSPIGRIRAGLAGAGPTDPAALAVADRSLRLWEGVHAALSPIIGHGGVVALYQRSLHLTRPAHPGLTLLAAADAESPWSGLHAALSSMPAAQAQAAADAMLQIFRDLLGTLIGPTLTERLLGSIPDLPSSGPAAPEAAT